MEENEQDPVVITICHDESKKRIPITNCLPPRIQNVLKDLHIEYLDQVQQYHPLFLKQQRNFGKTALKELREVLSDHGYALKGDFLCDSMEDKKLILSIPEELRKMQLMLDDICEQIDILSDKIENIRCSRLSERIEEGKKVEKTKGPWHGRE